jgi:uncharacterized damage-inducible protein DinB
MNTEILRLAEEMKEAYEGEPWFGRNAKQLLAEVDEAMAFEKLAGQHSIVELVWHMVTWKAFTINRLRKDTSKSLHSFEAEDWRTLNHQDKSLWPQGLQLLRQTHNELVEVVQQQKDEILVEKVAERDYTYRKLLNGVVQHDIYHLGQIALLKKILENR